MYIVDAHGAKDIDHFIPLYFLLRASTNAPIRIFFKLYLSIDIYILNTLI